MFMHMQVGYSHMCKQTLKDPEINVNNVDFRGHTLLLSVTQQVVIV